METKRGATSQMTDIRQDVVELLHEAFPAGMVEMPWHDEESYLDPIYAALRASLIGIVSGGWSCHSP